ncbi:MAG TPA: SLBB domain-containing protein [Gemmatimonadales bacterium]|nr:SLBB domain-containing protein [Gemmatimonadales bacterium]
MTRPNSTQRATPSAATLLCLVFIVAARPGTAQQVAGREVWPTLATRQQLESALALFEQGRGGGSPREAALIRGRLERGDFQLGDRIFLRVDGEAQLSDTFTVGPGPALGLPQVGAVPLQGLLRSELPERLGAYLARFIRDPVVQVRPLIRILIEGEVVRPGYYAVPPQLPLADAIGAAGGLTQRAKANAIRVERGSSEIWGGDLLREALGRGYSLDQLNIGAGDRLFVPARGDAERTFRILGLLVAIPVAVFTISRLR